MAYIQRRIPAPLRDESFSVNSMVGGLNNVDYTPDNHEATFIKNMSFSDGDAMVKRFGTELYNDFGYYYDALFIDVYDPYTSDFSDDENLIVGTKDALYLGSEEISPVNGLIDGVNFMGMYLFADGDKLRALGSFPQDEGTYIKIIGEATEDYVVLDVIDPPTSYVPLDSSHTRGITVYDYNLKRVWYEPCEQELDDVYAGFSVVPSNCRYIESHNGRLFVSGDEEDDDNVFISTMSNPFYFPASMAIQMPPNSDKIVGLTVFDDSVVVGRHRDIHIITGNSNNPELTNDLFRLRRINTHTGFMSNKSFDVVHNYLFFLGSDAKCYALSSINNDNHLLRTTIISKKIDLFEEPLDFKHEDLLNARSIFFNDEWYISIGDKWLVYSYEHRAWSVYYGIPSRSFCSINNKLVWGNDNQSLSTFSDEYLDMGKPFECRIITKDFNMGTAFNYKYFSEFFVVGHVFEDYPSDIRIELRVDYHSVRTKNLLKNQKSRWGISKWGDRFIDNNINISYPIPVHLRGRYISLNFANGWDVQEAVYTIRDLDGVKDKVDEETLCYVELEDKYFLYTDREWVELSDFELNQAMKIYEIGGRYTMRSSR